MVKDNFLSVVIAAGCIVLGLCGCSKELQPSKSAITFFASIDEKTKVYLDGDRKIRWNEKDCISIFGSATNEKYQFDGRDGDNIGTFSKVDEENATVTYSRYYGIFPYMQETASKQEGVFAVSFPGVQVYREKGFSANANIMTATTSSLDDTELSFHNAGSYLLLKIYSEEHIVVRSVTLRGNSGEVLAGDASVSVSDDGFPTMTLSSTGEQKLTLDCGEDGVRLSASKSNPTEFWMTFPPLSFSNGFTVEVIDIDGISYENSTRSAVTFSRGSVKPMAAYYMSNRLKFSEFSVTDKNGRNYSGQINDETKHIAITVNMDVDLSRMKAIFSHTGKTVKVNGQEQTSGESVCDFTGDVTYQIISSTGVINEYVVSITKKPIVGISEANGSIKAAIEYLGGVVVTLSPYVETDAEAAEVVRKLDGIIIPGGADIHPSRYGEDKHGSGGANIARDQHEFCLVAAARNRGISLFGICRGCQLLNVAYGGSLVQDIPSQWPDPIAHKGTNHLVYIDKTSQLYKSVGNLESESYVSSHHQCIKKLGEGLRIVARASDGVPEAFEGPNVMGTQFHPEKGGWKSNIGIFEQFINLIIQTNNEK